MSDTSLQNRRVAISETRRLDILAQLLEKRGADVWRVPMVGIHDAPDPMPVLAWLRQFIVTPPHEFIILTGEGVRRLASLAERHDLRDDFIAALDRTVKICRGPKPGRALTELGLKGEIQAAAPTTDGVLETLADMSLKNHRVAVQLYGQEPNRKLVDYLEQRGAGVSTVAPYVYADQSEEDRVVELIRSLEAGELDVVVFTSQPQYKRLRQVAGRHGLEQALASGLEKTTVAAVGPVVRDQLQEAGVAVQVMPERTYFMKPLVSAIARHYGG